MFALADGLGGHSDGDKASRSVVETLSEIFYKSFDKSETFLTNGFNISQKVLLSKQNINGNICKMKSTLICLVLHDMQAQWGHIGDSRLYWFRNKKILLRTLDHSVSQILALSGDITEREIRFHVDRNRLTRVMGEEWSSQKYELSDLYKIKKHDRFLLCSDGFWEYIEDNEMINSYKKNNTAEQWLINMNNIFLNKSINKKTDNYSAITVCI